jgi:bacterioferritin
MDVQRVIAGLNRVLAIEYAAMIQYLQDSVLIQGLERAYLADFFRNRAKDEMGHAERLGDKIVALGGIPTIEPALITQSLKVTEMLEHGLAAERDAIAAFKALLPEVQDDVPLRVMIEQLCLDTQEHIESFEKLLAQKRLAIITKEVRLKQVA